MSPRTAGGYEPRAWGRMRLPASASICQLKDGFNKSLSKSGEVRSLAGDRVVSRDRSRPADFPRRHGLCSRHTGPHPSDYFGCVSWRAIRAGNHRCRESVTARDLNSTMRVSGQSIAPTAS
jgi:hypothetical protein